MKFLKGLLAACLMVVSVAGATKAEAAPFYPSFHNLNVNVLYNNFSYYPSQGMAMQTLSVYPTSAGLLAAGSFDNQAKNPFYARGGMTSSGFDYWFNTYASQGYRPRELGVMINSQGQPEFTAIWKKLGGETFYTYINMTDADFNARWNNLVKAQGYRVEDYVAYAVGGQRRSAAVFVRDGQPFYMFYGMTQQGFDQRFQQLATQGFYPTSLNAAVTPQGLNYSAVWMRLAAGRQTATYINMTPDAYQARFNTLASQGFRLMKVQGYAGGTRFAAIWLK